MLFTVFQYTSGKNEKNAMNSSLVAARYRKGEFVLCEVDASFRNSNKNERHPVQKAGTSKVHPQLFRGSHLCGCYSFYSAGKLVLLSPYNL